MWQLVLRMLVVVVLLLVLEARWRPCCSQGFTPTHNFTITASHRLRTSKCGYFSDKRSEVKGQCWVSDY